MGLDSPRPSNTGISATTQRPGAPHSQQPNVTPTPPSNQPRHHPLTRSRTLAHHGSITQPDSPKQPTPNLDTTSHEKQKGGRHRRAMVPPTRCVRIGSRKAQASLGATSSSASPRWICPLATGVIAPSFFLFVTTTGVMVS